MWTFNLKREIVFNYVSLLAYTIKNRESVKSIKI